MTSPMKAFTVKTSIRATPERIWDLLTDAPGYIRWNNTVQKVDGKVAPRERVTVYPKINPGHASPVKVAGFNHLAEWSGPAACRSTSSKGKGLSR
jgi:uncharacterized protein YndB with AHSA1/START domain